MILFKLEVKCHKIQDNNLSTISFQQGLKMEGQGRIKDLVYEGATILPPPPILENMEFQGTQTFS